MSFIAPAAFFFAAAIPVVIIFYLLKRRRTVRLVSSTLLWQKFLAETQANAPFQRLRHNWLLILQCLLVALIVFALSRPFVAGHTTKSELRILILDGSASMQATDESPSRFEKAKKDILKWIDGKPDEERMMILLAGAKTEVRQSPTTDRESLRRAINSCTVSDCSTRLAEALKTAAAFTFEKQGEAERISGEIHLFSDGAAPDLADLANKNLPLTYHKIGQKGDNIGITGLDVRANPDDPMQRAIYAKIANYYTQTQSVDVSVLFNGQVISLRPTDLPPTNSTPLVFTFAQTNDGIYTVSVASKDSLAVDNQASVVSPLPKWANILLVTKGNRFLEKALRATPNTRVSTADRLIDNASAFDIVVLDDVVPAVWPLNSIMAIHVAKPGWFTNSTRVELPVIMDWKNTHPLMRFVSFDNVSISESISAHTVPWGISVLDSRQTSLMIAGEMQQSRILWIGFDTLQSSWPLRLSFPIFIANAIEWLNPANLRAGQLTVHCGEPFRASLNREVQSIQISQAHGSPREIKFSQPTREILIADTSQQGIWTLKAGTNEITYCVNLMDGNESDIRPRDDLRMGNFGNITASTREKGNIEFWRYIALAALALLLFEWWFYHKRTA